MNAFTSLIKEYQRLGMIMLMALSVVSCGGSSIISAGISGTGIVFGSITGFGSIYVNGVEYDIDSASFNVDGNTMASQADLKIGMVVKLDATDNGDGTGVASTVSYDELVQGPVSNLTAIDPADPENRSFIVLGTTVKINLQSTVFENTSFLNLQNDNLVEVSGFVDQNGNIIATLIEVKSGNEIELHGQINNLVGTLFDINGVIVDASAATLEDLENGLEEDLYVEVKGTFNGGQVVATEIEGEDDDRAAIENYEGEVSIQGLITTFNSSTDFSVNGVPVLVDTLQVPSSVLDQLALGIEIEVEGVIENSIIMADEVELRQDERKYQALVSSVNTTDRVLSIYYPNITGVITLSIDNESELEDEASGDPIGLGDLLPDDEVKIEASVNGDQIRIKSLTRDMIEKFEVSGVVESFEQGISITINNLMFPLEADVEYEPDLNFYNTIQTGITIVELQDEDKDSQFDKAEIEY
ncbi:MAG: DUF5666 domain-containing protein [Gammaproteobacteria bacterium]|nr:DUF5666 domain-containing protein [Gammaproteobacteria bacterium]